CRTLSAVGIRGARLGRRAPSRRAGLPREPRPPVRLLRSRVRNGHGLAPEGAREPDRAGDPGRGQGQPLSLHWLSQHHQGGRGGLRMAVAETLATAIGAPVARKEDPELLAGQAHFVDNLTVPGMVWMALLRSPYTHAGTASVKTKKARKAPGVVAAYAAAD